MNWVRRDNWHADSDAGYRIVISGNGEGFKYLAYGPSQPKWRDRLRMKYSKGESVPRERELIGCADNADQARALCDKHREDNEHAAA